MLNNKTKATLLTGWKYLLWTALAAGVTTGIGELNHTSIPFWAIPLVASALKSAATFFTVSAGTPPN